MRLRPCCSSEETALPSDVLPSVKTFQRGASILLKTIRSRTPGRSCAFRANNLPTIEGGIFQILEEAWTQLRARDEEAERVELTIVYADRQTSTLSAAVPGELLYDDQLISYGRELLSRALKRRIRVSSIGIRLSHFHRRRKQHDLFQFEQQQLSERFQQHVDILRRKYGNRIITRSFALYHG